MKNNARRSFRVVHCRPQEAIAKDATDKLRPRQKRKGNSRLRRIWIQIDVINNQNILLWVLAEQERVLARDVEFFGQANLLV
jgi:hypothetical protein